MPTPPAPVPTRAYRMALGWQILAYLVLLPLVLLCLAGPFLLWKQVASPSLALGLAVLLLALALALLVGLAEVTLAKHLLTTDRLIYSGVLRYKTIELRNLRGYRISERYLWLYSNNPADPIIRVGNTSEGYAALRQWFAQRYPNLDQQDRAKAADRLLQDDDLGFSPAQRTATVAAARQTARWLNGASGVITLWLLAHPAPYRWAIGAGLALPLLAAGALWHFRGALRPDEQKNSVYPSVFITLIGPGIALPVRAFLDTGLLHYGLLWPLAGTVAAAFGGVLLAGSWPFIQHRDAVARLLLTVVACAALYGFGATTTYNSAFDDAAGIRYNAQVLSKHVSAGEYTTHLLHLGPWGPRTQAADVTVSQGYYRRKEAGDSAHVYLKPGRLHVPWFAVME